MRRSLSPVPTKTWGPSRLPLALAVFIALSGACGGGDDGVPAEYETVPGPIVPQPPADRSFAVEGDVEITPATGAVASATLLAKVDTLTSVYRHRESGFELKMACGTGADVDVSLFFSHGTEILVVERRSNQWTVDRRAAEVVLSRPRSAEAGDAGDASIDAEAGVATDASVPPPSEPFFINGVGLPGADERREVFVTLVASDVRYDIRATIPWLASSGPATCQELKPGTGTKGSGGGCGGGSSSRRSSGGDWD